MRIPNTQTKDRRHNDERRVSGRARRHYNRKNCRRSCDREFGRTLLALSKMEWWAWKGWTRPFHWVLGEEQKNPTDWRHPDPTEKKTFIAIMDFGGLSYWHNGEKQYHSDLECFVIRIGAIEFVGEEWIWHQDLACSNSEEWCKKKVKQWIADECAWRTLPHVPGDPIGEAEAKAVADEAERLAKEKWERDRRIEYPHNLVDSAIQFINHGLKKWMEHHFPKGNYTMTPYPLATNKTGIIIKCGGLTHEAAYPGAEIYIADNGLLAVDNKGRKHCPQCGEVITDKMSVGFARNPASKKDPECCARCVPDKEAPPPA